MAVQEQANVKVTLNNEEAKRELDELNNRIKNLIALKKKAEAEGDVKGFKKIDTELKKANREAKKYEQQMYSVEKALKNLNGASFNDLKKAEAALVAQTKGLNRETAEYINKSKQLKLVRAEISKINRTQRTSTSLWGSMANGFNKYFGILTAGIASLTGVVLGFRKASNAFAEFDDQVADVMKTTGLTKDQVLLLDMALQKIDTRSSQEELLGLARIAGKLGITGVEDVEGFVRAADKVKVALTEDLGGDVEESIRQIGKLTDIFGLEEEFGIEQSILKVGSSINALGASSTASEEYLVEFTKRLAGIAPSANISIDKVLGLAATLDQLGQTSEVSSTVVAQVIPNMFKDMATYAKIAGMSITDFKDLLNKDANEAFIKFLEGMKGNNGGLEEMVKKLDGLGLQGKRTISVLGVLSNNTGTLREQQQLANVEFEKGTSLTEEFNIKNNTRQAQLEKSRKNLALITRELGQSLSPAVLVSTNGMTYFIKVMVAVIRVLKEYYPIIISSTLAIAAYTIALKLNTAEKRASFLATKLGIAIEKGYAVAKALVTGQIKLATIAQKAWNTAVKKNPIGAILAVVIAVGAAIWQYSKRVNQATAAQKALNSVQQEAIQNTVEQKTKVELLLEAAKNEKRSLSERLAALKELNQISPEYFGNLTLEKINTEEAKRATDEYIKSIEQKARVEAAYQQLVELEKKRNEELQSGEAARVGFWQSTWNNVKAFGHIAVAATNNAESAVKNLNKSEQEYLNTKKALTGIIEGASKTGEDETPVGTRKTIGDKVYEWTGKEWKEVQNIGGGSELTEDEIQKRIKKLEGSYALETALIKKHHLEGKTTEDQYKAELLEAELKFLADKLNIYDKGSKEYEEAVNQALEKQLQVDKTIKNLLLQAEKELASAKIENLQDGLDKQLSSEEQRWNDEKTALEKRLIDKQTLSEQEIAYNDTINQLIEEKEAEHQERLRKIKSAGELGDLQDLVDAAAPVDPNFATPEQQQAQFDARIALIEAQYEREKELAGNNQAALLAAEKKYQKQSYQVKADQIDAEFALTEKRIGAAQNYVSMLASVVDQESALGKALFLFNQALAIGDVWMNIAKANAKAIAASPLTLGQPWVTANTVQGAVQTGIILAQTVAKFTQNEDGKYPVMGEQDGRMYDANFAGKPKTGIYSGPQLGIFNEDPSKPELVVDGKTTRQLMINYPEVYQGIRQLAAGGAPQFAEGKYPTPAPASANLTQPYTPAPDPALLKAITRLNDNLEKGITANIKKYGVGGLDDELGKIQEFKSKVFKS